VSIGTRNLAVLRWALQPFASMLIRRLRQWLSPDEHMKCLISVCQRAGIRDSVLAWVGERCEAP
jgi:hypothetical protein